MAVSRALRRLLRIRDLEEEQLRRALETALGELRILQNALAGVQVRERKGRELLSSSIHTGEVTDYQSGVVETYAAQRHAAALEPRIARAETQAAEIRRAYLGKRVERRQAETLIEEAEARDAVEDGRKSQNALDEWYRSRLFRAAVESDADEKSATSGDAAAPRTVDEEL